MSTKQFLTVVGPESVIDALASSNLGGDIDVSDAQAVESLADAVDAPLGPEEIKSLLEFVTVAFEASAAIVALVGAVKELLSKFDSPTPAVVIIRDARTNDELAKISQDSDIDALVPDLIRKLERKEQ